MGKFTLNDAAGCHSPLSGLTTGYDMVFKTENILTIMKKDDSMNKNNNFIDIYICSIVFMNKTSYFRFYSETDRNAFYTLVEALL